MSLGFDTSGFVTSISKLEINQGDTYVFVVPKTPSERGSATIKDLKSTIAHLKSRGLSINMDILSVDEHDVLQGVFDFLKHVKNISVDHEEIYICMIGGIRSIISVLLLGCSYLNELKLLKGCFTIAENTGRWVSVPTIAEPIFPKYIEYLSLFKKNNSITLEDAKKVIDRNISNVSRAFSYLERKGFIKKTRDIKPYIYGPTIRAKIFWIFEELKKGKGDVTNVQNDF